MFRFPIRSLVKFSAALAIGLVHFAYLDGQIESIPYSDYDENEFARRTDGLWKAESAARALNSGLYDLASEYAASVMNSGLALDREQKDRLELVQIDSLLGRGRVEDASRFLESVGGENSLSDSIALRFALVALARSDREELSDALDSLGASSLDEGERAWQDLVRGWLALVSGDSNTAEAAFQSAADRAKRVSASLYSQVSFLAFRYRLKFSDEQMSIEELSTAYESSRGSESGYRFVQLLAVALDESNRTDEAIAILSEALSGLDDAIDEASNAYSKFRDELLLMQTLIAGFGTNLGRSAAQNLVIGGSEPTLQRIALQQLMSEASSGEISIVETLSETLDTVIERESNHPLTAEALYYRSIISFDEDDFDAIENDGYRLINSYSDSEYKQGMLTLIASASWKRSRYRTAASLLTQARAEFEENLDKKRLNILIADCYYRAGEQASNEGDFADAADAYRIALEGDLDEEEYSQVFFQLVLSHLNAGEIEEAKGVLDNPELSRRSTHDKLWQAEWTLIKQMRQRGVSEEAYLEEAYERINSFVSLEDLNLALQMKMLWLGSKLSYEAGRFDESQLWVDWIVPVLEAIGETELVRNVGSDVLLTLAESRLRLGDAETGLEILSRIREEFADSESAERSYLVEARYLSDQDLLVESSQLLNRLVDSNPDSKFAPLALYEIALNAEKRGQGEFLNQAVDILDRIANEYPESDLVYYARLKQGNLARMLNKFETAELVYESLENTFGDRPDRYWAQISLADTLIARASEDPSKFEAGISRLERLMDLPNVPIDLRVEAGYKIGTAWENQGEGLKAKAAYWDLYDLYVVSDFRIQKLGRKGQYWLSRSLFELAEIFVGESNLDMAAEFYEKIEELNLLGAELARARIEQLRGRAPVANL